MTTFVPGRIATCALVAWSGYMAAWTVASGAGPSIVVLWWLAGLALFQAITQSAARLRATSSDPGETPEPAVTGAVWHPKEAVQDWESEGGAIAEPRRAPRTARVA